MTNRVLTQGWVSPERAAEVLGVPAGTIRRRARRGEVVARKQGGAWQVMLHHVRHMTMAGRMIVVPCLVFPDDVTT